MRTAVTKSVQAALAAAVLLSAAAVRAEPVAEWNARAAEIAAAERLPAPTAYRALALVQVAVYETVRRVQGTGAPMLPIDVAAAPGASLEAAVAAANRTVLLSVAPGRRAEIEAAYQAALTGLDAQARDRGVRLGQAVAERVLAARTDDGAAAPESWRPVTAPGVYVPTATPVASGWGARRPWAPGVAARFRPAAPPSLNSPAWVRDYQEVQAVGRADSAVRTAEQTQVARFWETTQPLIYFNVVRSVAERPGRTPADNARLYARSAAAMDDALIAVMDAKYAYAFWRPITAIRNGDLDGSDATVREAGWRPLVETPMHPEYPCAHCVLAGAVVEVLQAEVGEDRPLDASAASPTAPGALRRWRTGEELTAEVASARIWAGVHYRASTEVGTALGRRIGRETVGTVGK